MSNRLTAPTTRHPGIPAALGAHGWTTFDYMLAAWTALPLIAVSPVLMAPPLWIPLMTA
jgi:hypothetical protein